MLVFLLERAGGHLSVTSAKRGQAGDRVDSGTWQPISPYSACTAHVERHLRSPGLLWLTTGLQLQRTRTRYWPSQPRLAAKLMIASYYHSPEPSAITVMTRSNRTEDPLEAWTAHVQEEGGCVRTTYGSSIYPRLPSSRRTRRLWRVLCSASPPPAA